MVEWGVRGTISISISISIYLSIYYIYMLLLLGTIVVGEKSEQKKHKKRE